MILNLVKQTSF